MNEIPKKHKATWDNLMFHLFNVVIKIKKIMMDLGCNNVEFRKGNTVVKIEPYIEPNNEPYLDPITSGHDPS